MKVLCMVKNMENLCFQWCLGQQILQDLSGNQMVRIQIYLYHISDRLQNGLPWQYQNNLLRRNCGNTLSRVNYLHVYLQQKNLLLLHQSDDHNPHLLSHWVHKLYMTICNSLQELCLNVRRNPRLDMEPNRIFRIFSSTD